MEPGNGDFITSGQVPKLRKHIDIIIQRSDGRMHEASISEIEWDKQSVVVEWTENGEIKGKSIEFPLVFDLNPGLIGGGKLEKNGPSTSNGNGYRGREDLASIASSESDNGVMVTVPSASDDLMNSEALDSFPANATKFTIPIKPSVPGLPGGPARRPVNGKNTRGTIVSTRNRATENGARDVHKAHSSVAAKGTVMKENKTTNRVSQPTVQQHRGPDSARDRNTSPRPSLPGNQQARMSNCARQVKKLEQDRNDRRVKLEEAKKEKQRLMDADPGNPNWQFLAMIREFQATLGPFKPLSVSDNVQDKQINVCLRKRPLNKKEETKKEVDVISVPSKDTIIMHECKSKVDQTKFLENQNFRFDYTFDEDSTNEVVYKFTAQPLIQTIFDGGMATCFAYGQTGSGKTHTMGGNFTGKNQDCKTGIYALAAADIFKQVQKPKYKKENFTVRASFFEIYSGKVFDLLNKKKKLRILENGDAEVVVCDLQEREVKSVDDVLHLIQMGNAVRTSGQTAANQHSSRSHAVFQIVLRTKSGHLHGKFSFIDLAGNERGVDTMSGDRQTRLEGAEINKSLLALKECIRALARKGAHLPFRASKLTQVLRDSFLGQNTRTCMIAMISPGLSCSEHTLNTLRYANRVKELDGSGPGKAIQPTPIPAGDEDSIMLDATASSAASELASFHEDENMEESDDMEQLETINALREAEDEVLEGQRLVVEVFDVFQKKMHDINTMSNEPDYDVDEYARQMQKTLEDYDETFGPLMQEFRNKFGRFREELKKEEDFSKSMAAPIKH